jgi:endonuclease/exonuclease/phosphatase family metal-dependent hydrolase
VIGKYKIIASSLIPLFSLHPELSQVYAGNELTGPSLKILSWNIQMLPLALKKIGQFERADYIAEQLNESDYDVIVFQEAFDDKVRQKLSEYLQHCYPYQVGPANEKGFFLRTNSGVCIVSKYPLKHIGEVQYENCNGVDCFSRKGALMVEIEKEGKLVQLIGTHLQSGDGKTNSKVRVKQYRQLEDELLSRYNKEGIPQIICGDFNTKKNGDGYYETMLSTLMVDDGSLEGKQQFTYDGSLNDMIKDKSEVSLLDYIFLRNNNVHYQSVVRTVKSFTANWHETKRDLSDHFALEITLN